MLILYIVVAIILLALLAIYLFLQLPKFGKLPSGERLARIERSPHYKNGQFHNLASTAMYSENAGFFSIMKDYLFLNKQLRKPASAVPTKKTDLTSLQPHEEVLVWFGHSSFFIRTGGKNMLFDPVLSPSAAPVSFSTRAFSGTSIYTPEDMPIIDYLFISHDHWDHLDYATVAALRAKVKHVICGLGVGAHLEHWGYKPEHITEMDWYETKVLGDGFTVHSETAQHFSGRSLRRNRALWLSFVIITPDKKIFYSGDSGYGPHFAEIGAKWGPFDLAILENGQYDENWRFVHMLPDEVIAAAQEVKAVSILPVHSAKFSLSMHAWNDPLRKIAAKSKQTNLHLLTPMIGEKVELWNQQQPFKPWWEFEHTAFKQ